jgi:hypothetical protein
MNLPTQIETDLFDYRSPEGQAETEELYVELETKPNACLNCGTAIVAEDSFCDDECKDAWWGIDKMQLEREKTAGQREDAEEHRRELLRDRSDRLRDEAIELMVREPDEERFDRNTEPQDNIPSEAVKSDR